MPVNTLIVAPAPPGTRPQPAPSVLLVAPAPAVSGPAPAPSSLLTASTSYIGPNPSAVTLTFPAGSPPVGTLVAFGGTLTGQSVTTLPDGRQQVTFTVAIAGGQGGKVMVTDPVSGLSANFFNTGLFDFSRPDGARKIESANKGNIFTGATPADCVPTLTFWNADGRVVAYRVINAQTGATAASGPVSAGAGSVTVPGLPLFGPYYIYALGAASQGQYGPVLGATAFGLLPTPLAGTNLPGLPPRDAFYSTAPFQDADAGMSGWLQFGPERYSINNCANSDAEHDNLVLNLNAQHAAYVLGPDGGVADPVRGRPVFVNFPRFLNQAGEAAGVTREVTRLAALPSMNSGGIIYVEGPNEPAQSTFSIPFMRSFFAAAHAATLPPGITLKVLGPCFVSANEELDAVLDACKGDYPFDEFSFHAYNTVNGDYDMGGRAMSLQDAILTKYGLGSMRRWQTEQSPPAGLSGLNNPVRPVAWLAAQTLVLERHHQPIETYNYWHRRNNADWGFPSWAENQDGSFTGTALFMRQFAEQVWCKPFASAYDFGPANALWYGNRFDGQGPAAGQSVSAFAGKQTRGEKLTLALSGPSVPSTLTVLDTYGNARSYNVAGNQVTLDGNTSPLVYIAHSSSLTLSPVGTDWGPNLALNAAVVTPTNQQYASRITNGVWENPYDHTARTWGSDPAWMASSTTQGDVGGKTTLPYSVIIDLGKDTTFSRIVLGGPPMWQNMSSILSAKVLTAKSADVTHVDANPGTVITGTAFASPNGNANPQVAFDGDPSTIYQTGPSGYVGLDAGTAAPTDLVIYTTGYLFSEQTLVGGVFEGSNTSQDSGYSTFATITSNPGAGTHTLKTTDRTPYRFRQFRAADGQTVNIGDIQFVTSVVAQSVSTEGGWVLGGVIGQENPLLEIWNDQETTATQATDYTPQVARWNVVLPASVTERFVRIEYDAVTFGGVGSQIGVQYGGQGNEGQAMLGDVQVFGR